MARDNRTRELYEEQVTTKVTKTVLTGLQELFEASDADSLAEYTRTVLTEHVRRSGSPETARTLGDEAVEELRRRIAAVHGDVQRIREAQAGSEKQLRNALSEVATLILSILFDDDRTTTFDQAMEEVDAIQDGKLESEPE